MTWEAFLDELGDWFASRGMLVNGAPWVIGVSGGRDSTFLLHAMCALSRRRGLNWSPHAAHLHHGLRGPAADEDAAFVAALAERLSIPHHQDRADIRAQISKEGGSVEDVARQRRYEFLERVALRTGSDCVAVAHHADDDAETILHRICRGTGLRGLAGMPAVRPIQPGSRVRLIRPLLAQRGATIETLCRDRNITYRLDESNQTSEYARGRIRNAVLPLLRETLNPNVADALLRLAEQVRWLGTYLEDAAARTFDSLVVAEAPGRVVLNVRGLLGKQRIIQAEIVRRAISVALGGDQDLSFTHIETVLRLAAERGSGKELHLPGPALVRKLYDRLEFCPLAETVPPPPLVSVFVQCPGRTALPAISAELEVEVCETDAGKIDELRQTPHPFEEWVDFDRVRLPLVVRGRQEGDRFWPLGAPGSKSLSEFFIEQKVDPTVRTRTGVLCDQVGPVWVMPLRIDERVKLRVTTRRALRLVLKPQPRT